MDDYLAQGPLVLALARGTNLQRAVVPFLDKGDLLHPDRALATGPASLALPCFLPSLGSDPLILRTSLLYDQVCVHMGM